MHVYALVLNQAFGTGIGAHVEAEDDGLRGRGQIHVRFGDAADHAVNHLDLDLVGGKFLKRHGQRLDRALDVGLDDQVEYLGIGARLLHLLEHISELGGAGRQLHVFELALTVQCDFARLTLAFDHHDFVAGVRHARESLHLDRDRRTGRFHRPAILVRHRTHTSKLAAGQHDIALVERAALYQHGRHRATALVQARLDHQACGRTGARCLEFQHLGLHQHGFQQLVDTDAGLG